MKYTLRYLKKNRKEIKKIFLIDMKKSEDLKDKIFIAPERISLDKWLVNMDKFNKLSLLRWSILNLNIIENNISNYYLDKLILKSNKSFFFTNKNSLPNDIINHIKSFFICKESQIFNNKKSVDLITKLNEKLNNLLF